ncbi:hypothetical protein [Actinoplanes subglobosus]|uniref:Uncharacterized protein n=1 Tax=Actinoplanes subglobosus TaxID=1547892 RepID=A0ABV8J843_9ACTN
MVVEAGTTGTGWRSRREQALARRIDRLRDDHARDEFEKAALRLRLMEAAEELWAAVDAVQQRTDAEGEAAWEARESERVRAEHATLLAALAAAEADLDRAQRNADDAEYRADRAERRARAAAHAAVTATERADQAIQRAELAERDLAEARNTIEETRKQVGPGTTAIRQGWATEQTPGPFRIPASPPDFPVTQPGFARAQVNLFLDWAHGARAGSPPSARFSMVREGFAPNAVIAYVRAVAGVLRTQQRTKVLNELPRE